MKTKYNIILGILILLMTSCYKDKSTSEFKTINEFSINGIEKDYGDLLYKKDTLKINPVIESSMKNQEYSYVWLTYIKGEKNSSEIFDTISTEKNLVYPVKKAAGKTYQLVFKATNKENKITSVKESKFSSLTKMSRGWYVLKDNNSMTDIDFFTEVDFSNKISNIISENNYSFPGKALSLSFVHNAAIWTWTTNGYDQIVTRATCIVPVSDESMSFLNINDEDHRIKEFLSYDVLFDIKPVNNAPLAFINSKGNTQVAINDNKTYKTDFSVVTSWGGRASLGFGQPISTSQEISSDLELSKHFLVGINGKSILFDKKSSSFLYLLPASNWGVKLRLLPDEIDIVDEKNIAKTKKLNSNKNLDADLLYADMQRPITNKDDGNIIGFYAYAILKNHSDNRLQLFNFKITARSLKDDGFSKDPIHKIDTILADHELASADKFAINKDVELLYYAKNNEIKYYDINYKQTQLLYTLPAGEEVTYMHHAKYEPVDFYKKQMDEDRWFNKLVVATHSGGKYKVYLFDVLQYNEQKLDSNPIILEGDGRVADALYVSPVLDNDSFANQHN